VLASASKVLRHFLSNVGRYKCCIVTISAVLVSSVILWLLVSPSFNAEHFFNTILYVCSAVIQAYAALIAILFTIAVVHLQSRYGYISIEFLFRHSLIAFIIFGVVAFVAVLTMLLASAGLYEHNLFFIVLLIGISLLPLPFVVNHIKSLFTLKPSKIADFLLRDIRVRGELHSDMYKKLEEVLPKVFLLAGLCVLDPSLEPELGEITTRVATFFKKVIEQPNSGFDRDSEQVRKELLPVIFKSLNHYIVDYLKHSKNHKPLVDHERLLPILNAVNDMVRVCIAEDIIHVGREYCYFINSLREITSIYIDEGRIDAALEIFSHAFMKLLESNDDILDLRRIQKAVLENPKNYEKLLPSSYDFYIDYVAVTLCTMFKLLLEKLPQNSLREAGDFLFYLLISMVVDYPILLAGYSFTQPSCKYSKGCVDAIAELILEQDEALAPDLLALLIAWMLKAYIMAENVLSDDDKDQVMKNIRVLGTVVLELLKERNLNAYAELYPSGELKLMLNGRSAPLSKHIYSSKDENLARLVSSYDTVKLCRILQQVLGLETGDCN